MLIFSFTRYLRKPCSENKKLSWPEVKDCLTTWRLYAHYLLYMGIGCCVSALSLFSPTIVAGLGYHDLDAQLFTVPPYAVAYVITLAAAMLSDRYKTRGLVAGICFSVSGIAFIIQIVLPDKAFTARYAMLIVSTAGVFGGLPSLCAWVGDNVRTSTAASLSIALNIAFSGPGQIVGVWIYQQQDAPLYKMGHAVNAGFMLMSAIGSFGLMIYYRKLNRRLIGTNEQRWIA